ncbi:sulfotransferase family 2 domain-containing protein [Oceanicoccus sagamiensis]|uniref:Sulfotransferase family protein n=1 Tax=Oceanicoccus sagamiensis TaxID=716816 RepID=A0A1X9NLY2_9GAMM|nr:sulfotransferase family 2 domain-containing protein [Oceanicoccus sagamiensis]ARN74953.1 hypothetical protein BST96_13010 [Oceanicoccus sagamiensis]
MEAKAEREKQLARWIKKGIDPDSLYNSIKNCRSFRKEIRNIQCSYLSRYSASFEGVKKTLKKHDCLIGDAGHLLPFQTEIARLLNMDSILLDNVNNSKQNYTHKISIDDKTSALIKQLNQEDIKLYNFVCENSDRLINTIKDPLKYQQMGNFIKAPTITAEQFWSKNNDNGMPWPLAGAMISTPYKLLYTPIAKCGNTSLKQLMIDLSDIQHKDQLKHFSLDIVTDQFNTGAQLKDIPLKQAREIAHRDDYFKFSVIREPMDRMIDVYIDMFVENRMTTINHFHTDKVLKVVQGEDAIDHKKGITFREFIDAIIANPIKTRDPHWVAQHFYLKGIKNFTKIYRSDQIEQLQVDLQTITSQSIAILKDQSADTHCDNISADGNNQLLVDLLPNKLEPYDHLPLSRFRDLSIEQKLKESFPEDYQLYQTTFNKPSTVSTAPHE